MCLYGIYIYRQVGGKHQPEEKSEEKVVKWMCLYGIYIYQQVGDKHQHEGKRKNYIFLGLC